MSTSHDAGEPVRGDEPVRDDVGLPPDQLSEDDLLRELGQLHRTRHETFLHAPTQALQHHSERTVALEMEYLRRHPERDINERGTDGRGTDAQGVGGWNADERTLP